MYILHAQIFIKYQKERKLYLIVINLFSKGIRWIELKGIVNRNNEIMYVVIFSENGKVKKVWIYI